MARLEPAAFVPMDGSTMPPSAAPAVKPVSSSQGSSQSCELIGCRIAPASASIDCVDSPVQARKLYKGKFEGMPEYEINVPKQQNSVDCGLYMLRYIEVVANRQPNLPGARRMRWEDAIDKDGAPLGRTQLKPVDITEMRSSMSATIKQLAVERRDRDASQKQAEESCSGGGEASAKRQKTAHPHFVEDC